MTRTQKDHYRNVHKAVKQDGYLQGLQAKPGDPIPQPSQYIEARLDMFQTAWKIGYTQANPKETIPCSEQTSAKT